MNDFPKEFAEKFDINTSEEDNKILGELLTEIADLLVLAHNYDLPEPPGLLDMLKGKLGEVEDYKTEE